MKPSQGTLSPTWCLRGFSQLRVVVLRTQEKPRLLSSLTEGGGNGSIFTKLPTQSRLSHPSMGCSGELPVPGGTQAGTNERWMASRPWWPFKESHPPPHTHTWLPGNPDPAQFRPLPLLQITLRLLDSAFEASGLNHPMFSSASHLVWELHKGRSRMLVFLSFLGPIREGRSRSLSKSHGPGLCPGTLHTLLRSSLHSKPRRQMILLASLCRSTS